MHLTPKRVAVYATVAIATAALTACSGGAGGATGSGSTPSTDLKVGSVDLKAAGCPANIVIQTDWVPESEHGHLYQMIAGDYTIDASGKSASGPLMASGEYTGVNLEIRAGGPAVAFSGVAATMGEDDSITMGYVGTDANIQTSDQFAMTAVFAPLDTSPFMAMWDPATYPDVTDYASLSDALVKSGGKLRYFGASSPYVDYMVNEGIIDASIEDGGYDGTPAAFVAAQGKDAQQGFASAEPYIYEHEVTDWGKKIDYALVSDEGWTPYSSAVSVRTDDLESLSGCLTALVPVMQQAEVDFFDDPSATIDLILDATEQYDLGYPYSQGVAEYSVKTQLADGLAGNGENDTIGDFDEARSADFFDKAVATFEGQGTSVKSGLTATDIYTNEFIDPSIGLK
jgi:hypothetical protein